MMKQIWSQNLKKCLKVNFLIIIYYSCSALAHEAQPQVIQSILNDLHKRKGTSFDTLYHKWEESYGSQAFHALMEIAKNQKNEDPHRYVALMSAAKLGGPSTAPDLQKFLKDPSWMIRSATLRALSALDNPKTAKAVMPLLKDPALLVRVEAIQAIQNLRPNGAALALMDTLEDETNYHQGKAQFVPQKALLALETLQAKEIVPQLTSFLNRFDSKKDPELSEQLKKTISVLKADL